MEDNVGKVIQEIERCGIKFVRLQFVDIHGTPKNMAVPLAKPDDFEEILKNGLLFDGSSVAGFVNINDSDSLINLTLNLLSPSWDGRKRRCADLYATSAARRTPYRSVHINEEP